MELSTGMRSVFGPDGRGSAEPSCERDRSSAGGPKWKVAREVPNPPRIPAVHVW